MEQEPTNGEDHFSQPMYVAKPAKDGRGLVIGMHRRPELADPKTHLYALDEVLAIIEERLPEGLMVVIGKGHDMDDRS